MSYITALILWLKLRDGLMHKCREGRYCHGCLPLDWVCWCHAAFQTNLGAITRRQTCYYPGSYWSHKAMFVSYDPIYRCWTNQELVLVFGLQHGSHFLQVAAVMLFVQVGREEDGYDSLGNVGEVEVIVSVHDPVHHAVLTPTPGPQNRDRQTDSETDSSPPLRHFLSCLGVKCQQ